MFGRQLEDTPTTGSIKTTLAEKRALALTSHGWNLKVPKFREVFPELATKEMVPLEQCMPWSLEKPTKEDVKEDAEEDAKEAAEEDGEKPTNGTVDAPKMANGHHDAPAAAEPVPKPANLAPQPALQEAPRPEPKTWSNMALFVFVSIIGLIVARVAQRLREEL